MIRLSDATILAYTKLRVHKIRTSITVIISSILFSLLVASLIVTQGAFSSIQNFSQEGFGNRYLISAYYNSTANINLWQDQSIIARAKEIYKETIAAKKIAASKLGITYFETSEQQPTNSYSGKVEDTYLNMGAPSAIKAIAEYKSTLPKYDMDYLKKIAASYHPIGFYETSEYTTTDGGLSLMKNGNESFSLTKTDYSYDDVSIESTMSRGFAFYKIDSGMTDPFLLKNNNTRSVNPNSIPVLIPYATAEKLLDLKPLTNASSKAKLDRIKEIQAKAPTISFSACYRNSISQQQINLALSTAADIEKNKNNQNYQKPDLIYGLPATNSCAAATILSDTRSSLQKTFANKQNQFDKQFGGIVDPDQQKIDFHIIGLTPDVSYTAPSSTATGILQMLVGSSASSGMEVPSDLYAKLPDAKRIDSILAPQSSTTDLFSLFGVEFASADDANKFIAEKGCSDQNYDNCAKNNRPFQTFASGSNSIALSSIKSTFANVFKFAALIIVATAAIIMSGTLGRMIADSRRETAVFRAIGFKRIDIINIYITYVVILSIFIAMLSFIIGIAVAYFVDQTFWQEFTVQSLLSFGASDMTRQFHFFRLDTPELLWVVVAILSSGLISTILPLARNIRRNPINDMRDE